MPEEHNRVVGFYNRVLGESQELAAEIDVLVERHNELLAEYNGMGK